LLIRLGRFKEAQAEIEALAEVVPRDARVWMKLGAVFYEQKLWDQAADAFRRAVTLEPSNLRARYFLATTYMDAGKDAEARAELERILRVDPRSIDARVQLGFLLGRAKRYDEAIAILRDAVNLEPQRAELFLYLGTAYFIDSLGWAYYQQGRYPEALKELKRAVEKAKEPDPVIYDHLGDAYLKNGLQVEALTAWEKALQLDPALGEVKKKFDDLKDN